MVSKKIVLGLALVAVIALLYLLVGGAQAKGQYDEFASCLTSKGAKMYGAYWCPHCVDQKKAFGNSWRLVNYVECSLPNNAGSTPACNAAKIDSYPTWEFAGGKRIGGVLSLQQLAGETGCNPQPDSTNSTS